jgi:membrane protein YdbS with pleckstrin-like domain
MTEPAPAMPPAMPGAAPAWRPLPPRARGLFRLVDALLLAAGLGFAGFLSASVLDLGMAVPAVLAGLMAGAALGLLTGAWRYRRIRWLLDEDGFAVARGRWWRRETRVPATRVQHLDLKHGPLERRWRLATLVVHTAGSKFGAVSLPGLDADDAEALRARLSRQLDIDDDAL